MFGASSQTDAAFVANVVIVVVADVVVDNFDRCVGRKTIDDSAMIRHYYKYDNKYGYGHLPTNFQHSLKTTLAFQLHCECLWQHLRKYFSYLTTFYTNKGLQLWLNGT